MQRTETDLFIVRTNSDMVEGRGIMQIVAILTSFTDAVELMLRQPTAMGVASPGSDSQIDLVSTGQYKVRRVWYGRDVVAAQSELCQSCGGTGKKAAHGPSSLSLWDLWDLGRNL